MMKLNQTKHTPSVGQTLIVFITKSYILKSSETCYSTMKVLSYMTTGFLLIIISNTVANIDSVASIAKNESVNYTLRNIIMGIEVSSLIGLIILILDVWAIVKVTQSTVTTGRKVMWIVLILLLPLLGLVLYALLGPE